MKKAVLALPLLLLMGCTPVERLAYNTIVSAKAFLDSEKKAHPECNTPITNAVVCNDLKKATASKDLIIDALEVYCSGPQFESGGVCQPSADPNAVVKLKAAIAGYNQSAADLKGVIQ